MLIVRGGGSVNAKFGMREAKRGGLRPLSASPIHPRVGYAAARPVPESREPKFHQALPKPLRP